MSAESGTPASGPHEPYVVRVMIPDVWDQVVVPVEKNTTVAALKAEALRRAGVRADGDGGGGRVVKFRGAALLDEAQTLGELGVPPNAPFIILPRRRQPVR